MIDRRVTAYLGLGSNLGDRLENLKGAVHAIQKSADLRVLQVSPVYESEAHTLSPTEVQPAYLNAVIEIASGLSAEVLLSYCLDLERLAGRERRQRWAPRPLDLDILIFGKGTVEQEDLILPHPHLAERRFVLQPLADLAPNFLVPAPFDKTVSELLGQCPDRTRLTRIPQPILELPNPTTIYVDRTAD